ncbi:MAG: LPS-assembly protein LptD [Cyclobacteriaceae bacterium]
MRRFVFIFFLSVFSFVVSAQEDSTKTFIQVDSIASADSTRSLLLLDSIQSDSKRDTTLLGEAFNPVLPPASQTGDIETTINYNARDSMIFDIDGQKLYLYGKTHIDYDIMTIESNSTIIDWDQRTLSSKFVTDSTGKKVGKPVFTQKSEVYETHDIVYNFKTKRALIKGVVTERDGAFMHGDDVKKNEEDELFIRGGKYSTCNLADPHFFIESNKIKVIPGNKVVTGPFNMKFREIPTPIWGPFGMFPQPKSQSSGIIFPSYGEEQRRGFFLRDAGYYFAFNEYIDLRLTGDIYSKGGNAITANSNYRKRYKFSGTFNFAYNKNIIDNSVESPIESSDYSVRWSHRPETRGNSSFSSSVNIQTQTYNANNNLVARNFEQSIRSQFSSNVGYTQRFSNLPMSLTINARHNQNVSTGIASMSLPDFSLNVNRIYPFKKVINNTKSPLAKISFSHNFVAKNEFTNSPVPTLGSGINVVNAGEPEEEPLELFSNLGPLYDRAKIGGRHTIPVSTSITVLKFFTLNPSFNYRELWYTRELDYTFIEEENGIRVDTLEGFSRAGSWNSGASLNTRFYGTHFFKDGSKIQAIRHVATPSVSFSYSPNFGSERYGVWQEVQIDTLGNTRRLSKYQGFAYGSPNGSRSETMSFSLSNNIEMKIRDEKDSLAEFKKVKLFDNLSMSSGYNFAADSFKLSNISWNARTSFFRGALSLNVSGSFDPYVYKLVSESTNSIGERTISDRRLNQYAWNHGGGLGQLQSVNTSLNLRLKPNKNNKGKPTEDTDPYNRADTFDGANDFYDPNAIDDPDNLATPDELEYIRQNPQEYVDFDLPWSMNIQYSINRSKRGLKEADITQSMSFNGSLALTKKTQVTFRSGYDFERKEVTLTNISVNRDLHCWSLSFNYVPFGRFQSFALSIRPKSPLLQQLKLDKRRSFQDNFRN